ncbi:MAG: hypothetical protein ABFE13_12145 [Phycisphaerales bacterium]
MAEVVEPATPAPVPAPAPVVDPPTPAAPTPTPTPDPTAYDPAKYDPKDIATWPAEAQKVIHDLRTENATTRTKATTAETEKQATLDKIATALGLKPDDDPAKAAQTAAEERDAALKTAQDATTTLAVYRIAAKQGANAESLTDSRSFMAKLEALDPAADDFATQVETAIKAALEANPSLATAPAVPARSGGPVGGGVPTPGQWTAEDLAAANAKGAAGAEEIVKAKAEGKLNNLLGIK